MPPDSDCDKRYEAVSDRWIAVFTLTRDYRTARRLLFDENYVPNEITSFLQIQNTQGPSRLQSPANKYEE